eukprot:PhF_6_TR19693/c0_g1_i1/m.28751
MSLTRKAVSVADAHKIEGRDVDDGLEEYETTEQLLAEETLKTIESNVQDSDFGFTDEFVKKVKRNAKTLVAQLPQTVTKKPSIAANQQNEEVSALLREILNQIDVLATPATAKEVQDTILRLKFITRALFLTLLITEGHPYEDHPVLYEVNDLLREVQKLGVIYVKPKGKKRKSKVVEPVEEEEEEVIEEDGTVRVKASDTILTNRGLTKNRRKDIKNPRLNQKRKYKRGVRKVRSMVKQFKPEGPGGFQGVDAIRTHVTKSRPLS